MSDLCNLSSKKKKLISCNGTMFQWTDFYPANLYVKYKISEKRLYKRFKKKKKKKACHISSQVAVNMEDQTLKQNSRSVNWWRSTESHYKGRQPGLWTEHWEAEALDSTCVTQHNSLNHPVLGSRTCATKELDLMNSKTQFQHFKIL